MIIGALSEDVAKDIMTIATLEGNEEWWYNILAVSQIEKVWLVVKISNKEKEL